MHIPCFHRIPLLNPHIQNGTIFNIYHTNYNNKILLKYSLTLDSKAASINNIT